MVSSTVSQFGQAVRGEAGVQLMLFLHLVVSVPAVPVRRRLRVALLSEVRLRLRLRLRRRRRRLLCPSVETMLAHLCGGQFVEDVWVKLVGQFASNFYDLAGAAVVPQSPRHLLIGHDLAVALPLAPALGQPFLVLGDKVEGATAAVCPLDRVPHVGVIQSLMEVFIKPELLTT